MRLMTNLWICWPNKYWLEMLESKIREISSIASTSEVEIAIAEIISLHFEHLGNFDAFSTSGVKQYAEISGFLGWAAAFPSQNL